jgi:signal transduction histidine kinase
MKTLFRFFSVTALALLPFLIQAQKTAHIDSLEKLLGQQLHDSTRVQHLIDLSFSYTFIDYSKGKAYAQQALEAANNTDILELKMFANQQLGLMSSLGGDYTSALTYETTVLEIATELNDSTQLAICYSNIGNYYHEAGIQDEAYYYLTRAFRIASFGKKTRNDSLMMGIALHNVGRVFKEIGQFETAIQHIVLSYNLAKRVGDTEGYVYYLDEMGDIKLRLGEYDSALYYLSKAGTITDRFMAGDPDNLVLELKPETLRKVAQTFSSLGEYEQALIYYDSAALFFTQTGNRFGSAKVEMGMGKVLALQRKFEEAEKHLNYALALSQQLNARILQSQCYDELSLLAEMKGDFRKALEFNRLQRVLNDSLFSLEMEQKIFRDQARMELAEKDDQIAALTRVEGVRLSELRKQETIRNILVVVMALTAILLFTVYRSGQRRKHINTLLVQHQQEIAKRRDELEQLNKVKDKFFSIISHDLRSPINALAGILDLLDRGAVRPEELPMALKELRVRFNHTRTLLNNLLDWTLLQMDKLNLNPTRIKLHSIVEENMALLISMQEKKIDLVNNVSQNAYGFADSNTINLVVRNLLTNALKFTNDGGLIEISAKENEKEWVVGVRDNGVGMKPEVQRMLFDKINPYSTRGTANEKGTGLGLILCKEFVEKNNGRIWVESEEGKGSTFWFTLPKA